MKLKSLILQSPVMWEKKRKRKSKRRSNNSSFPTTMLVLTQELSSQIWMTIKSMVFFLVSFVPCLFGNISKVIIIWMTIKSMVFFLVSFVPCLFGNISKVILILQINWDCGSAFGDSFAQQKTLRDFHLIFLFVCGGSTF